DPDPTGSERVARWRDIGRVLLAACCCGKAQVAQIRMDPGRERKQSEECRDGENDGEPGEPLVSTERAELPLCDLRSHEANPWRLAERTAQPATERRERNGHQAGIGGAHGMTDSARRGTSAMQAAASDTAAANPTSS